MITLLTDFGLEDEYVGVMKGVIFSIAPQARIVDISHHVAPQDILGAGLMLAASHAYFPAGSVHVAVVDPGVGTRRSIVGMRLEGRFFLAPDNGLLTPLLKGARPEALVRVANPDYFLHPVSSTFHGRDIFAPVAAHLSLGAPLAAMGPSIAADQMLRIDVPVPEDDGAGCLRGIVLGSDRFGNILTNIDRASLDLFLERAGLRLVTVRLGGYEISGLSQNYADAVPNALAAIMGSRGFLEIIMAGGNAQALVRPGRGDPVMIRSIAQGPLQRA